MFRKAYLLTCDENSERCIFSKNLLETIGFNVILFKAIPHEKQLLSHKQSMIQIYQTIIQDNDSEWSYIFEDDINILEQITLDEIIQYETISNNFFYLGMCKYGCNTIKKTNHVINNHVVYSVSKFVRGLHAVAFSRKGMIDFLNFLTNFKFDYIDMILELYTINNPANVIRMDLESYIIGHLGIFYQDRNKFQSLIGT